MMDLIVAGALQAMVLSIAAFGVMIPFRLLNFPDLTAEGSYPLGGTVCACLLLQGVPAFVALSVAVIAAGLLGMGTALIHLRYRVNTLLAGILLSTMIFSINLRLMGKPNLSLFDLPLLFTDLSMNVQLLLLAGLLFAVIVPFYVFLQTGMGLRLRAVGLNPVFAKRQGISITQYTLLVLFIGNAYVGLAGGLMVQLQRYMDITMGVGIVIHALAALMIGECILQVKTLNQQLLAPIVGAFVYQQIQGLALAVGLAPTDLKLLTGSIVLLVIMLGARDQYAKI